MALGRAHLLCFPTLLDLNLLTCCVCHCQLLHYLHSICGQLLYRYVFDYFNTTWESDLFVPNDKTCVYLSGIYIFLTCYKS
jgi:hypothetical protein